MNTVPRHEELFNPVLDAIKNLGSSARNNEITQQVIKNLGIPDEVAEQLHTGTTMTELGYRLGWSRTYLKQYGMIENSVRGVWTLTDKGKTTTEVDPRKVVDSYRHARRDTTTDSQSENPADPMTRGDFDDQDTKWRMELSSVLTKMSPVAFERLCQRLLRASGFIEVEVTGRPGDEGIDDHGIIRLSGLISFPVMFQCKRYAGSVSSSKVRDFRGAMQGRAEKGLILTTGSFTQAARKEATRDGAPLIDLIDGEDMGDLLKELGLGIKVTERKVTDVEVISDFFESI